MPEHDYKEFPELTNKQLEEFGFNSPHPQIINDFNATVVKVHDGDTVTLRVPWRDFDFPLRLNGIDAPEMSEGGEVARDWLSSQILNKDVMIKINRRNRVGKYGRLIGSVLSGGIDMGEAELTLGYVVPFGKKNEGQPEPISKILRDGKWF